jgi:glycine betaine/proline transport system substrate-binding protein
MHKKLMSTLVLMLLAVGFLAACGAQPAAQPAPAEPQQAPKEEAAAPAGEKITIKLAENPWSGSQVNVAVAKALLEDQLGYTVEIVTIDENAQWPALAAGDFQASLEVWPSGHAENVKQYIEDQGLVENAGPLGPVGEIGWFMPTYVLNDHPELATWEGFANPDNAKLFATAETGDKGQFLAGDPSWVQYDADIIKNLGMNFDVVTAGSEESIMAALSAADSRKEPLVFYFWTPHSVHAQYDLTQVQLPPYSDECYAKAESGGVDCAYPSDNLFKIVSADLKNVAPDAYEFLKKFNYSTKDQITMIAAVELDGKTPEEAAKAWIADNEATWKSWLP